MLHISELIKRDLDRQGKLPLKWYDVPDSPITDKCFIYVDAINNTGNGHSNSATSWRNLVNSSNNGIRVGSPKWQDDALIISDSVQGYRFAVNRATEVTMEAVFELSAYPDRNRDGDYSDISVLVANDNDGGSRLSIAGAEPNSGLHAMSYDKALQKYNSIKMKTKVPLNTKIYVASTQGPGQLLITSSLMSSLVDTRDFGSIVHTESCPWAIGFDPTTKSPYYSSGYKYQFLGKIYSIRVHSRVLTLDEIRKNMLYERNRYNF